MPKQSKSGQTSQAVGVRNEANLPFHPHANLFPLLGEAEIKTLSQDIAENGLQVPITLHEGKILDGRNRHVACILAGIEPRFVEFDGDDPHIQSF